MCYDVGSTLGHLLSHTAGLPAEYTPDSGLGVITLMNTQRDDQRYAIPETILNMLTD